MVLAVKGKREGSSLKDIELIFVVVVLKMKNPQICLNAERMKRNTKPKGKRG